MAVIDLYLFRFSHFCEKVAWGVSYQQHTTQYHYLLPGPHAGMVNKLSRQTAVPVLQHGSKVVSNSCDILLYTESLLNQPCLYPQEAELKRQAIALEAKFDALGAPLRSALFAHLLQQPWQSADLFTGDSTLERYGYKVMLCLLAPKLKTHIAASSLPYEDNCHLVMQHLDLVETTLGKGDYLVGHSFSIADLTAAAILSPLCMPKLAYPKLPSALTKALIPWFERWQSHVTLEWVESIYRKHRQR